MMAQQAGLNNNQTTSNAVASSPGRSTSSVISRRLPNNSSAQVSKAFLRAPVLTLSMLPSDHDVKQLLLAMQRVAITSASYGLGNVQRVLSSAENNAILVFGIVFKCSCNLSLTELLRLEALVAYYEKH